MGAGGEQEAGGEEEERGAEEVVQREDLHVRPGGNLRTTTLHRCAAVPRRALIFKARRLTTKDSQDRCAQAGQKRQRHFMDVGFVEVSVAV